MDYTYIKANTNKSPIDKEDFINELEKMCNALDVTFEKDNSYKSATEFLLEVFQALLRYKSEDK